MNRQTIRDPQTERSATSILINQVDRPFWMPQYRRLGQYDPRSNVTTDANYRRVGMGNLLVELLKR